MALAQTSVSSEIDGESFAPIVITEENDYFDPHGTKVSSRCPVAVFLLGVRSRFTNTTCAALAGHVARVVLVRVHEYGGR